MEKALVSVIVPVYNTAEYIDECVQTILSQSYRHIELLLVNDGSTDSSGLVCRKYLDLPNVRYFELERSGVTVARKTGVEAARGEWIMFVDSDDLIEADTVEEMLKHTKDTDIVVAWQIGNPDLLKAPDRYEWKEYLYRVYSGKGVSGATWAKLYRRQMLMDCPSAFEYKQIRTQDYLTNLAIAVKNRKPVNICKKAVYTHRMRALSVIHTVKYTYDYLYDFCAEADAIVKDYLSEDEMVLGRLEKHMFFFYRILLENQFEVKPDHPFVKDTRRCLDEAGLQRPLDRWLLSTSSPRVARMVWNLKKIERRLEQPSLIKHDIHRIKDFLTR